MIKEKKLMSKILFSSVYEESNAHDNNYNKKYLSSLSVKNNKNDKTIIQTY